MGVTQVKIAGSKAEEAELWQVRKAVSPAVVERGFTKISEDATVPLSKIPHMFEKVDEIKQKYDLNLVVFGHAGDGNLHPTISANMRDPEAVKMWNVRLRRFLIMQLNWEERFRESMALVR